MAVSKVVLAKLSPTMEEGTIVKWNKKEGDVIKVGDVLAEIETDKANMEMESQGAGVLRKILVQAGGKAPIGTLIGVIAEPNEDIAPLIAKSGGAAKPAAPAAAPAKAEGAPASGAKTEAGQPAKSDASGAKTAAPAAGSQATGASDAEAAKAATPAPAPAAPAADPVSAGANAAAKAAPGDQSASVASSVKTPPPAAPPSNGDDSRPAPQQGGSSSDGSRVKSSPLARSMAAQKNIDLSSVAGSGPGGRIIKRDIESWSGSAPRAGGEAAASSAPAARPAAPMPSVAPGTEIPLSSMRKVIAKRLAESKFTAPHFYVSMEIAMDNAVDLREQLRSLEDVKVSFNDLIVKACAKALTRFPMVNASWMGDRISTHAEVHIGVAVAVPDGLIVPVVRNADRKSIVDISREVKDLAGRARDKKLKPEEFMGSTFSISNLGMYDVTEFTAIINPPESAILAVGAVRRLPVVDGDDIRIGHRMTVTMSSDHRVVDGALAAQFLNEVRRLLESPVSLFV
jgi:pyruvate dehydrogenase E2 component (dihydrolipoamide acetyltransferase)